MNHTIEQATQGVVFDIQQFCVHDGPGIRTTVFLKGCNMRCRWCHNPESFTPQPILSFYKNKCRQCAECVTACAHGAHDFLTSEEGNVVHTINRTRCTGCGACVPVCRGNALSLVGRVMTTQDVMKIVVKDEKYYRSSGGGVTFSGGEPTVQFPFLISLLTACTKQGFQTALETNGSFSPEWLPVLLPLVNLFLFDIKHTDDALHLQWTDTSNKRILENLNAIGKNKGRVILRCPIIPGVNDNEKHLRALVMLQKQNPSIEKIELMPYHDIGNSKWERFGIPCMLEGLPSATSAQKQAWEQILKA